MAASGQKIIEVTSWDSLVFEWVQTSSFVNNNTSIVTWYLKLYSGTYGRIDSTAKKAWSVTVNGTTYSGTSSVDIANNREKILASSSVTINHNADGTKTFSYSFSQEFGITFDGSYIGTISGSGSGTLNAIARASQPSCITWPEHTQNVGYFGDTISIHMNRQSSSFTHTVRYAFGSLTGTIATNVGTGTTWTIPTSFMDLIPNTTKGSGTIYVDTYNGSTLVGTKYCGFTAEVPASVKPTCSVTLTDVENIDDIYGKPVRELSRIKVVVTPTLAYSSPITSYSISIDGKKYTGSEITTGYLNMSGSSVVAVTIKDSRGRTGTWSYTMTVLDYSAPFIESLAVHRCTEEGIEDDQGDFAMVTFTAYVTNIGANSAVYQLRYKKSTDSSWTTMMLNDLDDEYEVTDYDYIFMADPDISYDVEVVAGDSHKTAKTKTSVSTAFTLMDFHHSGTGMRFGGVAEKENCVKVSIPMEVDDTIKYVLDQKFTLDLTADFTPYGGNESNRPWCRKNAAGMVEVHGTVSPVGTVSSIGSTTGAAMFYLPTGWRPAVGFYQLCQGSGGDFWLLSIAPNGEAAASRYRTGSTMAAPAAGSWMPFHISFIADQ